MKDIGLDNEGYMNERVSLRKVWLIFVSKIWIFVLAVLIGALAGAGIYAAYRQMTSGTQYRAVSKLYVTFGSDDKEDAYQAYNGYTWNDLLTTDPVCDLIDEEFGKGGVEFDTGTQAAVQKYVKAEILSDLRVLTITVTFSNDDIADKMLAAVDKALVRFGDEQPEIESIKTIEENHSELVVRDSYMKQACGLGAIIAAIVCLFVMWLTYAVSDRVYLPEDVRRRTGLALVGLRFRDSDAALTKKIDQIYGITENGITGTDITETGITETGTTEIGITGTDITENEIVRSTSDEASDKVSDKALDKADVIYLRYKKNRTFIAEEQAAGMKAAGIIPRGFIIPDCSDRFYRSYYFLGK